MKNFDDSRIEVWHGKIIGFGITFDFFEESRMLAIMIPFITIYIDFRNGKCKKLISFNPYWRYDD